MKFIYIGYLVSRSQMESDPAVSNAGNNFQLGFVGAMEKQTELEVWTITPKMAWPGGAQLRIRGGTTPITDTMNATVIPFLNIRFLKEWSIQRSLRKMLKKYCQKHGNQPLQVITYNGNGDISVPVLRARKKYGFAYTCLVVDPPLYSGTTTRKGFLWRKLYDIRHRQFMTAAQQCDQCVVLNEGFASEMLNRQDYYVLDCGVMETQIQQTRQPCPNPNLWSKDGKIHAVFTGSLHEHSGILRFIEMFLSLDINNIQIHVFGKGIYQNQVEKFAEQDARIVYHGYIRNDQMYGVQKYADLLLCPNTIAHPINKVAFPSKLLEYMLSGVPVLATAVNGILPEYYPYLYLYDDTLEGLSQAFERLQQDPEERAQRAKAAFDCVCREKNWDVQVSKMLPYLLSKDHAGDV